MEKKTVLIVHSHEPNAPVFVETDKGLQFALHSGGIPLLNQIFEYLELRRYPWPEHRRHLVEQMRLRHGLRQFDMIVTMYPEALKFVEEDCGEIFAGIPILALYLPQGSDLSRTDRRIIGHSPTLDIVGTIEIALKLVPDAKRAYIVSGMHAVDKSIEDQARRDLKPWESRLELRYLSPMPFEGILSALSSAPSDTIVLLLAFTQDAAGNLYTSPTLARQLSQVSSAPIFGLLDVMLGHGIVGGSLISFQGIGAKSGELVMESIGGKPADPNISKTLDVAPMPMFDWRQLKRWNLDVGAVPDGSITINRESTLWDFKYYIICALTFILAQSGLILMLLAQSRRRRSAERSLRQTTEELDRFFSVSLDLLCIANTGGYFLRLNPAWEEALGYRREDLMAKRFFDFVHPDDLTGTEEAFAKLASQRELTHFNSRYRCKDGTYRVLEWAAACSGGLIYAAARDITDRLEIESEARQRREELAHLARVVTMGELAASLAHEINQPLSAIMSNAQAAKRFLDAPTPDLKEVKEILNDIVKEDARAGEVIHRMRTLLKKSATRFEPVDLNLIFQEVVGLIHSDAVIRDVTVSLDLDPALPKVQGDPIQLQQVALNLILNAFDATSERPRERRRTLIRTRVQDSLVVASVVDNGTGIRRGDAEKIFEPFYSCKPQGLGMGLSISRSIINRHHGRIWADGNSEGGATFYFSLPAATERWALLYGQEKR